jgi:colanic acid biosynthesis glycosyl transferase WcaI
MRWWNSERRNNLTVHRVPHYVPGNPTGPARLLHQTSFALAAAPQMLASALAWRPGRIIAIAPSLLAAPLGLLAARLSGGSAWLHMQDLELETALATGLLAKRSWVRVLAGVESRIIRRFDGVSTISPAMGRRLVEKGVAPEQVTIHRNWADLSGVKPLAGPSAYREKWKISTPHVALYSGALGRKQGLDLIISAARRLASRNDLTFVICGNGPYRAELEAMVDGLNNIRFFDLQPREHLGQLLGLGSMHLLPQIGAAADLVLPSKLTNMLASGRPIIATTEPGTGLYAEITDCGLAVPPGDVAAFAGAIEQLCESPALGRQLGAAARKRAETHWRRETILARFIDDIEAADGRRQPSLVGEGQSP